MIGLRPCHDMAWAVSFCLVIGFFAVPLWRIGFSSTLFILKKRIQELVFSSKDMNVTASLQTESYHLVLQKFINLILFGKIQNPKFLINKTEVPIHKNLSDFFHSLDSEIGNERSEIITAYYHERLDEYLKKLQYNDRVDLMNCYGFSNFRVCINIFSMLESTKSKKAVNPQIRDAEIMMEMVWEKKLPEEIRDYLCMQFFDIFNKIPTDSDFITEEQYQNLVGRYIGEYNHNKVINILYQKFEEID